MPFVFVAVVDLDDVLMANAAEDLNLAKDSFLLDWLNKFVLLIYLYCIESLCPFLFADADCCISSAA